MANWASYALSDFMPFSLETYQRLGALYNARFSVAVFLGLGFGLMALVLALLRRPAPWQVRAMLVSLGLSWLWISWAFQLQTLAPLLWAGELFALAFALQSGLLLASAALPLHRLASRPAADRPPLSHWLGFGMVVFAVLLLPLIELVAGQPWQGLSLFGSAATPTAIGTLGIAAVIGPRLAFLLMPVPVLWCLTTSLLLLGLGDPLWMLPACAFPLGLVAAMLSRQGHTGR